MNDEHLKDLEAIFLAFSDPTRLSLVGLMAGGEVSVSLLAEQTGESQPKISRHLAYLRDCGVVTTRRDGKWIFYSLQQFEDPRIVGVVDAVIQALGPDSSAERGSVITGSRVDDHIDLTHRSTAREDAAELEIFLL